MGFSSVINSLFLATLLIGGLTQAGCFTFTYPTFEDTNQGDFIRLGSYIALGAIQVTPDVNGATMENRAGRLLYQRPFKLWKSKGNNASFNTTFVLNIKDQTTPGGEGLAFILAGDDVLPDNSSGQWLGIVNSQTNGSAQPGIVAIEFDTRKSFPEDPDDNHVGFDINSIYSTEQVSLSSRGINISAGINISVNVQYDGKNLSVFVGDDMKNPVILRTIDLSEYLPKEIFVGFSASTSNYTQLNCVRSWEFSGSEMVDDDKLIWVWIVVPLGLVLLFGFVLFLYLKRKFNKVDLEDPYPSIEQAIQGSSTAPQKFRFKELSKATGKFNPKNKLGKGGFGTVYKGFLGNKEVAVKRVSKKSTQGKQEFIAEVTTIGNLHHRNLVKLIGWCYESREFLLLVFREAWWWEIKLKVAEHDFNACWKLQQRQSLWFGVCSRNKRACWREIPARERHTFEVQSDLFLSQLPLIINLLYIEVIYKSSTYSCYNFCSAFKFKFKYIMTSLLD